MSKKQKKPLKTPDIKKLKSGVPEKKHSLFDKIENYLGKRHHAIALGITVLSLILALLTFDAKVSTGLDDSTYIEQGYKYSLDFFGHFFTSQAPFYAMVLALPIFLFGINIIVLKLITLCFFVLSVYFLYRAFRFRMPWLILFASILIYATNSEALKYASLTYSESLFLLFQSALIWIILTVTDRVSNEDKLKTILKKHSVLLLVMGVLFYFAFLTRTVGIATLLAVFAYYFFRKEWKLMLLIPGIMAASYVILDQIKKTIWSTVDQFSTQSKILFQKDAYDASLGNEDFTGFLTRFLENANQYLSSRLYEILGFREYPSDWLFSLMIITVIPLLVALIKAVKVKQKAVMFSVLYLIAVCGFTFFGLQTSWGQPRYIMILLPFIFIAAFWLMFQWFSKPSMRFYQFFALLVMIIFLFKNVSKTLDHAQNNIPIAKANLFKGDKYAGYTPDWVNFLRMSEWCAKNLDDTCLVASRKAPMSFLYSNGKEFYPIWRTSNNPDPDSTLNAFKQAGVTHVILGSLRVNKKVSQGAVINTVHRILQPISIQYPEALQLVHKEGETEETVLFKIIY